MGGTGGLYAFCFAKRLEAYRVHFRFEDFEGGRLLHVDRGEPPRMDDEITQIEDNEWRITLRWSKEAIAEAAMR